MAKKYTQKPQKQSPKPKSTVINVENKDFEMQPDNAVLSFFSNKPMQFFIIMILSFLLYANTLGHGYALDDGIVLTDNMFTQEGLKGIPGILKYDTFYGFFKEEGKAALVAGGRYRPLTLVTFAIEQQLFGKNPFISHLINILLYGLTGILLYLLLIKLLRKRFDANLTYFVAWVTAILFIVHPIHTEAVANIKGRDEIITLLGCLGAVYLSLKAFETQKFSWNIAAAVLFFLALMSKENAIMFLFITPLVFYFFTEANGGQIIGNMIPWIVSAVAFIAIRTAAIGFQFGGKVMELMNNPFLKLEGNQYVEFSTMEKFATNMFTLGKYVLLLIFPKVLTHDYYPRVVEIMSLGNWQVLLSLVLYAGLIFWIVKGWKSKSINSFAILFYLITLSIVSNFIFPVGTNMGERFVYMPSLGFCLLVASVLYWIFGRGKEMSVGKIIPALALVLLVAVVFSYRTIIRNPAWKDNYTLFMTDIKNSPNSAKLCNAVGGTLCDSAKFIVNTEQRVAMLNEAIPYLTNAARIHPGYKNAFLLLGNTYYYLAIAKSNIKDFETSIDYYNKGLIVDPSYRDAFNNKALAYREMGKCYGEKFNDNVNALKFLTESYKINPNDGETARILGVAYGMNKMPEKAIEYFDKAAITQPNNPNLLWDIGVSYSFLGDNAKAEAYKQKARQINPNIDAERGGGVKK